MKKLAYLSIFLFVGSTLTLNAQNVLDPSEDAIFSRQETSLSRVVPYHFLQESDVMWETRVWETIDLREKINHPLYYPLTKLPDRKSLWDVFKDAIDEGTITQIFYDDRFQSLMSHKEFEKRVFSIDTIPTNPDLPVDPNDRSTFYPDTNQVKANDIVGYNIKTVWYFDKKRGEMKARILGIAPVELKSVNGTPQRIELCWIYFPDARLSMATHEAFNMQNNTQRRSFDQLFHLRMFNSFVYKEENVYDRRISEYKNNSVMDQLIEGQAIREELRTFEMDLWEY